MGGWSFSATVPRVNLDQFGSMRKRDEIYLEMEYNGIRLN